MATADGRLRSELEELTVSGSNRDGSVTITVGHGGALRDLELTDAAMRCSAAELGQEILRGTRAAQSHLVGRVDRIGPSIY